MIKLALGAATSVLTPSNAGHVLIPRFDTAGNAYVSSAAATDDFHLAHRSTLEAGTDQESPDASFLSPDIDLRWMGKNWTYAIDKSPGYVLGSSASNILRFESRYGDVGLAGDASNSNTRCEIISPDKLPLETDLWESFAFRLRGSPTNLPDIPYDHCLIGQWHGADTTTTRSPICITGLFNNLLSFTSRYAAGTTSSGTRTIHYQTDLPAVDTWTYVVKQINISETGTYNVWLNGTQVVNYSGAVGYPDDATGPNFQCGIYREDYDGDNVIVELANVEFGTSSLSARITTPLSI